MGKNSTLSSSICTFEEAEYYPEEGVYRVRFDADTTAPSTAIIAAVAAVKDVDPMDIDPIQRTVNTDALNALFDGRNPGTGDIHVRLHLDDYEVTVSNSGRITVDPQLVG